MAYQRQAARRNGSRQAAMPGWLWLLLGLTLGLAVAWIVFLYVEPGAPPPAAMRAPLPPARPAQKPPVSEPAPKPRFDFYTILPEMEVVVPEDEAEKAKDDAAQEPAKIVKQGIYFLQAGSFRGLAEADRRKAQLALLGIEAGIEKVTINDDSSWHRVRAGPYQNLAEVNRARGLLEGQKIPTILLKVKR